MLRALALLLLITALCVTVSSAAASHRTRRWTEAAGCLTVSVTRISSGSASAQSKASVLNDLPLPVDGVALHVSSDLKRRRSQASCKLTVVSFSSLQEQPGRPFEASAAFTDKNKLFISLFGMRNARHFVRLLASGVVMKYSCIRHTGDRCFLIKKVQEEKVHATGDRLTQRSLSHQTRQGQQSSFFTHEWLVSVLGLSMGVVLLTFVIAICVKSSEPRLSQDLQPGSGGTLRILAGPPPEYFAQQVQQETVTTEEATLHLSDDPSSPSPLSHDRGRSPTSPGTKKPTGPLPEIPKQASPLVAAGGERPPVNHDDEEDEQDEDPYDYAKFDGQGQDIRDVDSPLSGGSDNRPPPPPNLPGSYAVVTRHSESDVPVPPGSYSEIRQVGRPGRGRSSTDPVEPNVFSPHFRTFTESGGAGHHLPLPLPLPPRGDLEDENNGMYDSIENLRNQEQQVYDSLDNDEDNEMYESVPEELKEELGVLSPSAAQAKVPPLLRIGDSSGSPSPTKRSSEAGTPDSPTGRKFLKSFKDGGKKGKQRPESTSMEEEKHRVSFFNRIRSSSTSAAVSKKETKRSHEFSPEHFPPSLPPLPPQPLQATASIDDDEDEDDTYDSVRDRPLVPTSGGGGPMTPRSATLPPNMRPSVFSPRVNEPLPEVPEDSGSGSASLTVTRDRVVDKGDPNYDTVSHAQNKGRGRRDEEKEDDENEPDYDTVQRNPPLPGGDDLAQRQGHSYAKVTSHSTQSNDRIDHDTQGYAVVDPRIVERKRVSSLSKKENPYDKVGDLTTSSDEPALSKKENPYDKVSDQITSSDEPGYSSIKEAMQNAAMPTDTNEPPPTSLAESLPTLSNELPPTDKQDSPPTHSAKSPPTDRTVTPPLTADEAYAIIDPEIVQRKRLASINKATAASGNVPDTEVISVDRNEESVSPAPPLPPVGDLGDISEFDPPPVPQQNPEMFDQLDDEPPYAKVGVATSREHAPPTSSSDGPIGNVREEVGEDPPSLLSPAVTAQKSVRSSSSSDSGVPVYDSLEPQQPLYDSLDPPEVQQAVYDSLLPSSRDRENGDVVNL